MFTLFFISDDMILSFHRYVNGLSWGRNSFIVFPVRVCVSDGDTTIFNTLLHNFEHFAQCHT